MSAPRTDLDRQKRRHRGPLLGMALVTLFGVGIILYWLFEEVDTAGPPGSEAPLEGAPAQPPQDPVAAPEAPPPAASPTSPAPPAPDASAPGAPAPGTAPAAPGP